MKTAIWVDNRCIMTGGKQVHSVGEAFVQNAPFQQQAESQFSAGSRALAACRAAAVLDFKD